MKVGDRVEKIKGGLSAEIVSVFTTKAGLVRVVVEYIHPVIAGALYIYAPEQLRVVDSEPETTTLGEKQCSIKS